MNHCWASYFLAFAPVLMLLWGGCLTASRTELKQGVVLDERRPVVLSAKEVLSQQELDEATAWAEYAKGSSLLIEEKPDFDQAAAHLTKALSLLPDSHSIATALIGPRLAGKEMEKAVAELKIVADANQRPIPNLLSECTAMLKRQDRAIGHLLKPSLNQLANRKSSDQRSPDVVETKDPDGQKILPPGLCAPSSPR